MSTKSIILLSSLFIIMSGQSHTIKAAFPTGETMIEDEFEEKAAIKDMRDLLNESDIAKGSLLEAEAQLTPAMKTEVMPNEPKVNYLDKNNYIDYYIASSLKTTAPSLVMETTEDGMLAYGLAKKLLFSDVEKITSYDIRMNFKNISLQEAVASQDPTNLFISSLKSITPVGYQSLIDEKLVANLEAKVRFSPKPSIWGWLSRSLEPVTPGIETYMKYETPS